VAEQKPIPVRLSEDVIARLDKQAAMMGSNRAAMIRYCTTTFLNHIEKTGLGGMPANWQAIVEESDGRRKDDDLKVRAKVNYREVLKGKKKKE
jgi:hypothetical protein